MKKIIALLLCAVLLCSYAVPAFAVANLTFKMTADKTTLQRGDEIELVFDVTSTDVVDSFGLRLVYDKNVFEITDGWNDTMINYRKDTAVSDFSVAEGNVATSFKNDVAPNMEEFAFVYLKVKENAPIGSTTFSVTASAKLDGVAQNATCNSITFNVTCDHNWGTWGQGDANKHSRTCSKCGSSDTANHEWNAGTVTKPASCKEEGVKSYTCSVCNRTKTEPIAKTDDHSFGAWEKISDTQHKRTCTICGTKTETANHKWDAGNITKPATCKEEGVKTYTCSDCKATKTEPVAKTDDHSFGAWEKISDTQHKRTCTICGTKTETANHKWDNGAITTQPDCKDAGVKTYTCSDCKGTKTEPVPSTGNHGYGAWEKISDTEHKRVCTGCNEAFETASHKWDKGVITKPASCKEEGVKTFTCGDCKATKTEPIAKLTTHDYGTWVKLDDNNHKRTCKVCGDTVFETAAHTWNAGTVTKPASCKEEGVKTFACTACGATKTEPIAKLTTHDYGAWVKLDDNNHKRTCKVCGDTVFETAAHTWNAGAVTKVATCKEEGVKTFTCTACGATKTESIAKLTTHTYDHDCDTDCNVCGVTRTTEHKYGEKLSSDKDAHFYACTVCGNRKDAAAHVPGPAATEKNPQTCTVCGYIIKPAKGHSHKYANGLSADATGHWYTCSGCNERKDFKAHDFDNDCDVDCNTCKFTRTTEHKFGEEWSSDKESHFHACTVCGEKKDVAEHAPGVEATETTAQTCTACGYEIVAALGHTHAFGEVWEKDDAKHWKTCACGEKGEEADHIWSDDGSICTVCLAEQVVEEEEPATTSGGNMGIIAAAIAAVVVIGGIVAVVLLKKKKV